jgi:hypothetical protein
LNPIPLPRERPDPGDATVPVKPVVRTARLILAVVWTLTILALCLLPGVWINEVEKGSSWFKLPNLDKLVHSGIFVLFSILWLRVGSSRSRYIGVVVGGLALGAGTELLQNLPIVGRDGNLSDALTDFAGVLLGLVAARFIEPLIRYVESRIFRESTVPLTNSVDAANEIDSPTRSTK